MKEELFDDSSEINQSEAESSEISKYEFSTSIKNYSLEFLALKMHRNEIVRPSFQRNNNVWDEKRQSSLILSIIKGIPIPPLYLFNDTEKRTLNIIDGLQRSTTIYNFIYKNLTLNIPNSEYHGKKIDDISYLKDNEISIITITQKTPIENQDGQYEVFRILNQTSVPLNKQEIRNCIYRGVFNDLIVKELAEDNNWISIYNQESNRFEDAELILRCFVVSDIKNFLNFKSTDNAINRIMEKFNKNLTSFHSFKNSFLKSCEYLNNLDIKLPPNKKARTDSILGACIYANEHQLLFPTNLKYRLDALYSNEDWKKSVNSGTGTEKAIKTRLSLALKVLFDYDYN